MTVSRARVPSGSAFRLHPARVTRAAVRSISIRAINSSLPIGLLCSTRRTSQIGACQPKGIPSPYLRVIRSREPILEGCPCPACAEGFSRAYLHYLLRAHELTGQRLITLHNLSFVARLMADLRDAVAAGRLREVSDAVLAGAAPGSAATSCTG